MAMAPLTFNFFFDLLFIAMSDENDVG